MLSKKIISSFILKLKWFTLNNVWYSISCYGIIFIFILALILLAFIFLADDILAKIEGTPLWKPQALHLVFFLLRAVRVLVYLLWNTILNLAKSSLYLINRHFLSSPQAWATWAYGDWWGIFKLPRLQKWYAQLNAVKAKGSMKRTVVAYRKRKIFLIFFLYLGYYFARAFFIACYLLLNIFFGFVRTRWGIDLQNNKVSLTFLYLYNFLYDKYKETVGFYLHNLLTKIYIFLRRFFYYLSISEYILSIVSFFQEVNKSQVKERLAYYEPEHYNWRRSAALPIEIFNLRFFFIKLLQFFYPIASYLKLFFYHGALGFILSFYFIARFLLGFLLLPFYITFLAMPKLGLLYDQFTLINQLYFIKSFTSLKDKANSHAAIFYLFLAFVSKSLKTITVFLSPVAMFLNKIFYLFYWGFFFVFMHLLALILKSPVFLLKFLWKFSKRFGFSVVVLLVLFFAHEYLLWFFITVLQIAIDNFALCTRESIIYEAYFYFYYQMEKILNHTFWTFMGTRNFGMASSVAYWKRGFWGAWTLYPPKEFWNWINTGFGFHEMRSFIFTSYSYNAYHLSIDEWQTFRDFWDIKKYGYGPWTVPYITYKGQSPCILWAESAIYAYIRFIEKPIYMFYYTSSTLDRYLWKLIPTIWELINSLINYYESYYTRLFNYFLSCLPKFSFTHIVVFNQWYQPALSTMKNFFIFYWNLIFMETIPQFLHGRDKQVFYFLMLKNIESFLSDENILDEIHTALLYFLNPANYFNEIFKMLTIALLTFLQHSLNFILTLNKWSMERLIMAGLLIIREYVDHCVDSFLLRWRIPKAIFFHPNYRDYTFHYTYKRLKGIPFYRSHQVETFPYYWNAHLFHYWTYFQLAYKTDGPTHGPGDFFRFLKKSTVVGYWTRMAAAEQLYFIDLLNSAPLLRVLTYARISHTWERYYPAIYYITILLFLTLSSSFRGLMLPRVFEGSSQRFWEDFRRESDQKWWDHLLLVPNAAYRVGASRYPAESNYLLGDEAYSFMNLSQLRKDKKNVELKNYSSTPLEYRGERRAMQALENKEQRAELNKHVLLAAETQEFSQYRRDNLKLSYDLLFFRNIYMKDIMFKGQSLDINKVKNDWKNLLAPNIEKPSVDDDLLADFASHYYDLKGLLSLESLRYTYDTLSDRTWRLLNALKNPSFNLQAVLATFNYDYDEEVRAEYLHQPWVMDNWCKFLEKANSYFSTIDQEIFGNDLADYFLHKDYQVYQVTTESFSYVMQKPFLRTTPQLFMRAKNKEPHYGYYPESLNLSIALSIWLGCLPILIWIQGAIFDQDLDEGGMTKTERMDTELFWNSRIVFLCYFETWQYFVTFSWHLLRFLQSPMRAGSIDAFEPPTVFPLRSVTHTNLFYASYYYFLEIIDTPLSISPFSFYKISCSVLVTEWLIWKIFISVFYLFWLLWFLKKIFNKKGKIYFQFKGNLRFKHLSRPTLANLVRYQKIKQIFTKGILYFWL